MRVAYYMVVKGWVRIGYGVFLAGIGVIRGNCRQLVGISVCIYAYIIAFLD